MMALLKIWLKNNFMRKNKNDYENLYEEYKELEAKTNLVTHNKIPGKKVNFKYIKTEDIERFTEIQKELIENYRDDLKLEDKIEIEKMLKR